GRASHPADEMRGGGEVVKQIGSPDAVALPLPSMQIPQEAGERLIADAVHGASSTCWHASIISHYDRFCQPLEPAGRRPPGPPFGGPGSRGTNGPHHERRGPTPWSHEIDRVGRGRRRGRGRPGGHGGGRGAGDLCGRWGRPLRSPAGGAGGPGG